MNWTGLPAKKGGKQDFKGYKQIVKHVDFGNRLQQSMYLNDGKWERKKEHGEDL